MALSPAGCFTPGCSQQCPRSVIGKSSSFAYAGPQSVALYRVERQNIPSTQPPAGADASVTQPPKTVTVFPLDTLFGHGITAKITAFDYNDEFMACLTAQNRSVHLWKLSDAQPLSAKKLPASLSAMFKKDCSPSTMCLAGKHHLIFGTTAGHLVSLNTNGSNEPRSIAIPEPTAASRGSQSTLPGTGVEGVECVMVSPSRADLVACGTADGTLCVLSLSATTGLSATASLRPFPAGTPTGSASASSSASPKDKSAPLSMNPLPVTVIAFDPNTPQYLAVGSSEGALALFDLNANAVVQQFEWKSEGQVSAIAWVPGEAGSFYTANAESNRIDKWSTSSKAAVSSFSPASPSVGIRCIACLDAERMVLSLSDGAVSVYNVSRCGVDFVTEGGHTDTLVCCRYSKHDRDLAASCGVDGFVRVWNMAKMTQQYNIDLGPVIVNEVDWSPNGKHLIAALSTGEVVMLSCATQRVICRTSVCPDAVHSVCWSASESNLIATISRSGLTLLSKDGKVLRRYGQNPQQNNMLMCDVEPTKGKLVAVGCSNNKVYIFNLSSNNEGPGLVLSGHNDTVSDVAFNPTVPSFLITGSHDGTVRIWDLSSNDAHSISVSARVLSGHAGRVRAVAWCSVAPYLAFSGAADATLRVWDVRNGATVAFVRSHSSDVRRVCSHPDRPLVLLSVGQDCTLAVWHLTLLRQLYLDTALGTLEQCIVADPSSLMAVATGGVSVSVVAGAAITRLAKQLRECTKQWERMEKIAGFFEHPCGAGDIANIAAMAVEPQSYATDAKGQLVVPSSKLVEAHVAQAKHAADKARGKTVAAAGSLYSKGRLLAAADEMLHVGKFEDCCALLMEAKEWDRAAALAPLLSRDYWRAVCLRAAEAMEAAGDARAINYYIFAEESARAARLMTRQSTTNYSAATVISQTCPQRSPEAASAPAPEMAHQVTVDTNGVSAATQELQRERAASLAQYSNPRLFSAAFLAQGNNDEAVRVLLRTGDVVLAHLLVHTVPLRDQASIDGAYRMAMLQSARQHKWETAVLCAGGQSNRYDSYATLITCFQHAQAKQMKVVPAQSLTSQNVSAFQNSGDKLKSFYELVRQAYQKQDLQLDPNVIQQRHATDGLASQNQLAAMVLSADPQLGPVTAGAVLQSITGFVESLLNVALQDADGANAQFYLKQAYNVTGYVSLPLSFANVPGATGQPTQTMAPEHRKFLALAYAVAALMCVKVYRLPKLLNPAFAKAVELSQGDSAAEQLMTRVKGALGSYAPGAVEVDCAVLGCHVPITGSEGKQSVSALSGEAVRGPRHMLEDGSSTITKGEALEWVMCCHFSPLGTGVRMMIL